MARIDGEGMMGKAKRKAKALEGYAPTPEQMASGAFSPDFVLHSESGLKAKAYVNTGFEQDGRLFKENHFDRFHRAGIWTKDQYLAGCWYRDAHERGRYDNPAVADLMRVQGSVASIEVQFSSKQTARDMWRSARMALPRDMIGYVDGLLLRNRWPKMYHRERARSLARLKAALDELAHFLRFNRY